MQTTFENTEKQHLRRKELERHMQIISSAGGISDLEEFSDNLDIQGLADDMTGQPLTKVPIFADGSNSNRGRTKGRRVALAVAVLVATVVLSALLASSASDRSPSFTHVDQESARYRHLFSLILDFKITPRKELEDKESPQAQALKWLAFEDVAENVEDLRTRFSLASLYFSTRANETIWKRHDNWLSADPVCLWYGVECIQTRAKVYLVKALNLSSNGLSGTIPEEIALLKNDCRLLDLSYNNIEGTIPTYLGKEMQNLQRLYLTENPIASTIPETLFDLGRLTHLYIDSCKLKGIISESVGKLTGLHGLALHKNELTGSLPSSLGALTGLRVLNLDENRLKGPIPSALGSLSGLVDLRLNQNQFTGVLPSELARLILLEILYLDNNQLGGKLPKIIIDSLPFLSELHLHNNHFTGTIPIEFSNIPFLKVLYLDGNSFIGNMPDEICKQKQKGVLEDLWADCGEPAEVECSLGDCCTRCLPGNH